MPIWAFYNGTKVGQAGRIQVGADRDQFPVLVPGVVMEKGKAVWKRKQPTMANMIM